MSGAHIEGMDGLRKKVARLENLTGVKAALKAAGKHVEGKVKAYPHRTSPSRASVYGSTFKSDKQRRFFFAALRSGSIDVPYKRGISPASESHGRRWTTRVTGLRAVIGANTSYGPLLQDAEKQTKYAAVQGWKTTELVAEQEADVVRDLLAEGIRKDMLSS